MSAQPSIWIRTSWKMNKALGEAQIFAKSLARADGVGDARIQRFVIPPFTAVREVSGDLGRHVGQGRRPEHALGRRRRIDWRDLAADA